MTASRRASLLVVFAHPDDEIFHGGMLMHLSQHGVRVTLVCATNGEAGKTHPSVGAVDDLGALRIEELRVSCNRLGIDAPVLLGFHDSARGERQRHDDPRALANVDMLKVEAAIRRVIEDVTPHVILTFDPHGGYYHPDHLAVQRATTAAFFSSGAMGAIAPERLFYATMLSRGVPWPCRQESRARHRRRPGSRRVRHGVRHDRGIVRCRSICRTKVPGAGCPSVCVRGHRGDAEQPSGRCTRDARCVPSGIRARSVRSGWDAYCNLAMAPERFFRRHRIRRTRSGELENRFHIAFEPVRGFYTFPDRSTLTTGHHAAGASPRRAGRLRARWPCGSRWWTTRPASGRSPRTCSRDRCARPRPRAPSASRSPTRS